ncbi:MAG: aminotransferase class I/II-fold pyridoxal phosphate-dependent enzyme [Gammaproteobacteria bacterium]|nr:aminotransferase class I/II-fold pyridoxal phosphate-dependent enzyme [Pseudomonadales bacterium]MCP5349107.1 aminotransferase class I/II-fold pyridoxal phosphate-dependent enzyme [Pseudomonadales bacterium]
MAHFIGSQSRRSFIKNVGVTALAGATGAGAATNANAQSAHNARSYNGPFDFDTVYSRVGTNCSRWDGPPQNYPDGVFKYGMGVASMDFECAPCITDALQERIAHHNYGYLTGTETLKDCIVKWNGERKGEDLHPDQIVLSDGVYPGVIAALRAFVPANERVVVTTPCYSGFYSMARGASVQTVDSPMKIVNGRYTFDFDDLETRLRAADVRALILCNPQNPTGNVWKRDELLQLGRLCLENNVIVLSDEIHCDVIRAGHKFTPFASLPDQAVVNNSVSFSAISKTFSLAGMKNAFYYSKNPKLLDRVNRYHRAEISTLGVVATEAAYNHGGPWFDQVNAYMDENHTFIENYIKNNLPTVGYTRNEGTYMTFLDFSKTMAALDAEKQAKEQNARTPEHFFRDWLVFETGVYFNAGSDYGTGGEGRVRMNIASSRSVIKDVLDSIANAVNRV